MNEQLEECLHEMVGSLRRSEHSYYVSLKYTRTVDVIRNLLERYIKTLEHMVNSLIEYEAEKNPMLEKPQFLIAKINLVQKVYDDKFIQEAMDFLLFLRKALRAKYGKCEEFRRNVTMSVKIEGKEHNINIDSLGEYYEQVSGYIKYTVKKITGNEAE